MAGVDQVTISVPDGSGVTDAMRSVAERFGPSLRERLFTESGNLQRSILLFVNDQAVAHDAAAQHGLKNDDVLLLYPPISGG